MRLTTAQLMTAVRVPWTREFTDRISPPAGYELHLWPNAGCLVISDAVTGLPLVYVGTSQLRWGEIVQPKTDSAPAVSSVVVPVVEDEKTRRGRRQR